MNIKWVILKSKKFLKNSIAPVRRINVISCIVNVWKIMKFVMILANALIAWIMNKINYRIKKIFKDQNLKKTIKHNSQ